MNLSKIPRFIIFKILIILFNVDLTFGNCFSQNQLMKMQRSDLADINQFLKNEQFQITDIKSQKFFLRLLNNDSVKYNKIIYSRFNNLNIELHEFDKQNNLIKLNISSNCYDYILLNEFSGLNKETKLKNKYLIISIQIGDQIFEFYESADKNLKEKFIIVYDIDLKSYLGDFDTLVLPIINKATNPIINVSKNSENDEIFDVVENSPEFPGGMGAWVDYLSKNLNYPTQARRIGIEGAVYVAFVVNTDGSIQDVQVLRGIGGGCDEEALRVVSYSPKWIAGKQRGKPVKVRMRLPIKFTLS